MACRTACFAGLLAAALGCSSSKPAPAPACNSRPQVTAIDGPSAAAAGAIVTLSATVTDADTVAAGCPAPSFTYVWSLTSRPAGSNTVIRQPDANPAVLVPDVPSGAYQVQLVVTDETGLQSPPRFFTLTTSPCGSAAPIIGAVSATPDSVNPRATITLGAIVTDPDDVCLGAAQPRSYAWSVESRPPTSAAVLSDPTAAAPTFVPDVAGAYAFQLVVTDATGRSSAPSFVNATASACALVAPSIAPLGPMSGVQLNPVALTAPTVTDLNCLAASAQLTYRWAIVAAPAGSGAVLTDPASRSPGFTPDRVGAYQFSVVVTNSEGISSTPAFLDLSVGSCGSAALAWQRVAVTSVVDPQLGSVGPIAPNVGAQVTVTAEAIDPNTACGASVQPIAYRWAILQKPAGSAAVLSIDAQASSAGSSPVLVPDVPGSYQLAVTATDAFGNTSVTPGVLAFTTSSCGANPPVAAINPAGPVAIQPFAPEPISVSITSADDTSCPARFHVAPDAYATTWSITGQPVSGSAALARSTGATTSFEAFAGGVYVVHASVTAPNGLTSSPGAPSSSLTLSVAACGASAPSIVSVTTVDPVSGAVVSRPQVGQPIAVLANAVDPDASCGGHVASYAFRAVSLPGGSGAPASSSGASNRFTFTPDVVGTYVYGVTATDDTGLSSAPVEVTIETAACGPVVVAAGATPASPSVGSPVTFGPAAVSDACIASPSFTYAWSLTQRPAASQATLGSPSSASTAIVPDAAGTYQVQLVVTDSAGLASAPAVITVQAAAACGLFPPSVATNAFGLPDFRAMQTVAGVNGGTLTQTRATDPARSSASGVGSALVPFYPGVPVQLLATVANGGSCAISYAWSILAQPAGSAARLDNPNAASPSFTPDVTGVYAFQLTLTDAAGRSTTSTLANDASAQPVVTVGTCGLQAPVIELAALPTTSRVQLDASGTVDPDATPYPAGCGLAPSLTYAWSIVSAPAGSTASVPSQPQLDPSFAAIPGTYAIALTVGDGGAAARGTITATVAPSPAATSVTPTSGAIFTGSATDLQGNPVVAVWDNVGGTVTAWRCTSACSSSAPTWVSLGTIDSGLAGMTFLPDDEPRPIAVAVGGAGGVPGVGNIFVAYHTGPDTGGVTTGGMPRCGIAVAECDGSVWRRASMLGGGGCDAGATIGLAYGRWLSMVTNRNGVPLVGFSAVQGALGFPAYGACNDATCTTTFASPAFSLYAVMSAAGTQRIGRWTSLALRGDDVHAVSYSDDDGAGNRGLFYSTCSGCANPAVGPVFTSVKIDGSATADVGRFSSFAVLTGSTGPSLMAVYRDQSSATASYASCPLTGPACTSAASWRTGAIADPNNAANFGRDIVIAADPSGTNSARVAYVDATNAAVTLFSADAHGTFAASRSPGPAKTSPAGLSIAFGDGSFTAFGSSAGTLSVSPGP